MKGSPRSLWLSAMNRAGGWWLGHAANAVRRAQAAAIKAATKPKRVRKPRRKA